MSILSDQDLAKLALLLKEDQTPTTFGVNSKFTWGVLVAIVTLTGLGATAIAQSRATASDLETVKKEKKDNEQNIKALQIRAAESTVEYKAIKDILVVISSDIKDIKTKK